MAALLALITDIHSLGLPAAQGLLLTTSFYWDMDGKTREWSKRYFAKMNRMPTMWQAGVYSSVMHYLNAIKEVGTDDPLKVAAKMREKPIEDFFARNGKLRDDNLMVHDLWLVQVKSPEESKYPWDYYKVLTTISGADAFGPPNPDCPLVRSDRVAATNKTVVPARQLPRLAGATGLFCNSDLPQILQHPGMDQRHVGGCGDRVCGRGLAGLRELLAKFALDAVQRARQMIGDVVRQVFAHQDEAPRAYRIDRRSLAGIAATRHGERFEEIVLCADARDLFGTGRDEARARRA